MIPFEAEFEMTVSLVVYVILRQAQYDIYFHFGEFLCIEIHFGKVLGMNLDCLKRIAGNF
jgi:hypothetical protein